MHAKSLSLVKLPKTPKNNNRNEKQNILFCKDNEIGAKHEIKKTHSFPSIQYDYQ